MKRITVKNFGPIKDVSIELKDFNFFIGSQGVGKSTIAKLISILTDLRIYWDMAWAKNEISVWKSKLIQYNILNYLNDDTLIKFEYAMESEFETVGCGTVNFCFNSSTIRWDVNNSFVKDNKDKSKHLQAASLVPFINRQLVEDFRQFLCDFQNTEDFTYEFKEKFLSKTGNSFQNVLYIPAERILFSMFPKMQSALSMVDQSIPKMFLFYSILLNDAKAYFKTYHIDMLSLDYQKKEDEDIVRLDNGKEMPLNTTSSGMQSLIPLLLTLDYSIHYKGFHSYVIEEPECNLFPDNQCLLIDSMIKMLNESGIPNTTLTITTHSPYVINYLNVLMRRAEKNSDKPSISSDNLSVYMINDDGTAENLMSIDNHTGKFVVNTFDLTEKMTEMYAEYNELS